MSEDTCAKWQQFKQAMDLPEDGFFAAYVDDNGEVTWGGSYGCDMRRLRGLEKVLAIMLKDLRHRIKQKGESK